MCAVSHLSLRSRVDMELESFVVICHIFSSINHGSSVYDVVSVRLYGCVVFLLNTFVLWLSSGEDEEKIANMNGLGDKILRRKTKRDEHHMAYGVSGKLNVKNEASAC